MLREVQSDVIFLKPQGSQWALFLLNRLDKTLKELEWSDLSDGKRARLERRAENLTKQLERRSDWSPPEAIIKVERDSILVSGETFLDSEVASEDIPVCFGTLKKGRTLWRFRGKYYQASDDELTADDVKALINQAANARRLKLQKAHALEAMGEQLDSKAKRQPIPQDVKVLVWQRDNGRCADCGANQDLEFDHIIPLAMGGSNTARNLQLLCAPCNRRKGATLG